MRRLKGQSATEYLMTYGWALLAIAIVGALLYMYVFSDRECIQKVDGFEGQNIAVVHNKYQVYTNGSILFMVENKVGENATISKIVVKDDKGQTVSTCTDSWELAPRDQIVVGLGGVICNTLTAPVANEDACKRIKISIEYTTDSGMTLTSSGSIIAKYVAPA